MAVPYSLKNATLTFTDNDGVNTYVAILEDGDLSVNIPNPAEHVLDRGGPGTVIDGMHEDVTWSMTVQATSFTADPSITEVVGGLATGWTFTQASGGDYAATSQAIQDVATAVKLFQLQIALASPTGGSTETLFLLDNNCALTLQEGAPDKWSMSSTCMGYSGNAFLTDITV